MYLLSIGVFFNWRSSLPSCSHDVHLLLGRLIAFEIGDTDSTKIRTINSIQRYVRVLMLQENSASLDVLDKSKLALRMQAEQHVAVSGGCTDFVTPDTAFKITMEVIGVRLLTIFKPQGILRLPLDLVEPRPL